MALGAERVPAAPAPASEPAVTVTPEMRLVSVLFVDLVGFTALSESREAEDVRELLGRYFDSARTIVDRYAGVVEKFIGDALSRRRGNRFGESINAGNLMSVLLLAGRWEEMEQLAAELLAEREDRPGGEFIHHRLARLAAHRGLAAEAREHLQPLRAWKGSDNEEIAAMMEAAGLSVALAAGDIEHALRQGVRMLPHAVSSLGASHDSVRDAWPDALDAALALGRLDEGAALVALLAEQPPGHIPPYLAAHLARGRGLVAAAEGSHDAAETDLGTAIDGFRELGYPYWLAVSQTDLANGPVGEDHHRDATPLLDDAIASLAPLGAAPALARAEALRASLAPVLAG